MGMAMKKGAQKYVDILFSMVHKLAWCINWCRWKVSWCGWKISRPALFLEVSIGNVRGCFVSHLFLGLTTPVLKPSRAFHCLDKAPVMPIRVL